MKTTGALFDKGDSHFYEAKEPCGEDLDSCLTYVLATLSNGEVRRRGKHLPTG